MTEITDNNQRPTTLAPASLFNQDISKRCDAVIEKYCEGTIDKLDALFAIRNILPRDAGSSEAQKGAAIVFKCA